MIIVRLVPVNSVNDINSDEYADDNYVKADFIVERSIRSPRLAWAAKKKKKRAVSNFLGTIEREPVGVERKVFDGRANRSIDG